MDNIKDEVCKWVWRAKEDLQSAEYLLEAPLHPRPHNVICYLCQQSVEKILKAKIVSMGMEIPMTHDLRVLLKKFCNGDKENERYKGVSNACVELNPYSIKARYPNEDSGQTKEQSSRACVLTKKAFEVFFNELKLEYELTDEEPSLELFEGAKNIHLPEHKPAYPKSIKKEP